MTAARRLFTHIKERICNGEFRIGHPLPKTGFFTLSFHVSKVTVLSAFRQLAAEKLAHKQGKTWVAGAPIATNPYHIRHIGDSYRSGGKTVLVLSEDYAFWDQWTKQSPAFRAFSEILFSELETHHFRIQIGLTHDDLGTTMALCGMPRIREFIRASAEKLTGIVLGFRNPDLTLETTRALAPFKKKILLFDITNDLRTLDRRAMAPCEEFYRFHRNEPEALKLLLQHLYDLGHRQIGLGLHPAYTGQEWGRYRVDAILTCAKKHFPELQIFCATHSEPFWVLYDQAALKPETLADKQADRGSSAMRATLPRTTPSLHELLVNKKVTALLALNDYLARDYGLWCEWAGFSIPRQVSIVSIANAPLSKIYSITSVDFCFDYLGYLAAHLLTGSIPVVSDRFGNVAGRPRLILRNSSGSAPPPTVKSLPE